MGQDLKDTSDLLMLRGVTAFCADCAEERIFVPVEDGCAVPGCEYCCTGCDAAVFLLEVLQDTPSPTVRASA